MKDAATTCLWQEGRRRSSSYEPRRDRSPASIGFAQGRGARGVGKTAEGEARRCGGCGRLPSRSSAEFVNSRFIGAGQRADAATRCQCLGSVPAMADGEAAAGLRGAYEKRGVAVDVPELDAWRTASSADSAPMSARTPSSVRSRSTPSRPLRLPPSRSSSI